VILAAFVVSLLPYVSNAGFQSTESQSNQKRPELRSVPGEILVRFRSHATIVKGAPREELLLAERQGAMVVSVERLRGPEIFEGLRIARVRAEDTHRAIEALRARPDVIYAEPNYIRKAFKTPNDPRFAEMWGLKNTGQSSTFGGNPGTPGNDVRADQAWEIIVLLFYVKS
jgi:hypothetical protein